MRLQRYKILILPRTYPGRLHRLKGVFVQKQAEAQAAFDEVAVLNVIADPDLSAQTFDCQAASENGCQVVRVFFRKNDLHNPLTAPLFKLVRFVQASRIGYQQIRRQFGVPDLLHVHMALPGGFLALWLWWTRKIPYLVTEHLTDYMEADGSYGRAPFLYRLATKRVCRSSRAMTAVSQALLDSLLQHHLVTQQRQVIANVIDAPADLSLTKRTPGRATLLTACLLSDRQKNISGLLAAMARVLAAKSHVRLLIAGDGPDRSALQSLAVELGIAASVHWLGLVAPDQMEPLWQQADLYVMNSRYESFSVATAEALLHGTPVVVTACGGPESFVTSQTGRIVQPGDVNGLSQAILYCLDHLDQFDAKLLQQSVRESFSGKRIGGHYHQLYSQLVRSRLEHPSVQPRDSFTQPGK